MRRQLPTTAADTTALDGLPALLGHAAGLKVVLDGAGQVAAGEGAVVPCFGESRKKMKGRNEIKWIKTAHGEVATK